MRNTFIHLYMFIRLRVKTANGYIIYQESFVPLKKYLNCFLINMIVDLSREDKNSNQRYKYCYIFASDASFSKQITFSTSAKIGESYDVLFTHVDVIFSIKNGVWGRLGPARGLLWAIVVSSGLKFWFFCTEILVACLIHL